MPKFSKNNDVAFSSNSVRLSGREWVIAAIICLATLYFGPELWGQLGELKVGPDYRLPYKLSGDYWLYDRLCGKACAKYQTVLVGDSVIWGHYVPADATLSHYLNEYSGQDQFANLGVDGFHPAALWGLVKYYGRDITNKEVILHLNPLWMSNKKQDLQTEKEYRFHHPKLVPQFRPRIPSYKESWSDRVSIVIGRHVDFPAWTSHLRTAYFENMNVPAWTMKHPYENPLKAVTLELPVAKEDHPTDDRSWNERGMGKRSFHWVELGTSLQWKMFRRTVELLRERDNTVFVLVGPFNEHMIEDESLEAYDEMKDGIEDWLQQNNTPYLMPEPLPGRFYSDASHPLAEGYALLAKQVMEDESFKSTILGNQ